MDVIGAKILAGFLFFFLAMFFGWMPFWCYRRCTDNNEVGGSRTDRGARKQPSIVQYLHSMAAGVLIATCLLSLLPESLEAVRDALEAREHEHGKPTGASVIIIPTHLPNVSDNDTGHSKVTNNSGDGEDDSVESTSLYPVAECLVALGFMFIYMIDSTIKSLQGDGDNQKQQDDHADDTVLFQRNRADYFTKQTRNRSVAPAQSGDSPETVRWGKPKFSGTGYEPLHQVDDRARGNENRALSGSDVGEVSDTSDRRLSMSGSDSDGRDFLLRDTTGKDSVATIEGIQRPVRSNQLRSVALVAALCIHGFFDGVMLGLQTSKSVILSLLFALSLHKSFVAIGLSLTLVSTNESNRRTMYMLLYITLFATVAPLGLVLSAAFVHRSFDPSGEQSVGLGPGCLQAFAVGTFMYVTFTETTERHQRRVLVTEIISHVFLLSGFALMAGLRAAIGDA